MKAEINSFMGIQIIVDDAILPEPKLKISEGFKWCSAEFRAEYNQWLLEEFGTRNVAYMFAGKLFCNPDGYLDLKKAVMVRMS